MIADSWLSRVTSARKKMRDGKQSPPAPLKSFELRQDSRTQWDAATSIGHFPGNQQRPDVNSRLSIEHPTILGSKTLANASFCYRLRPTAPPGIEKAPGRLTTGALAAPFSPGGSIKAAAEIISVVRKNLTSNHRKDCVAIFAPSRPDFGQYLETADALAATRAGSARPWAEVAPTSDSRAGFAIRLSFGRRHTCPETLQT
jgi:hypothetical protein